ncbi:MAG: CinA family protein [Bacillota bacterium]|nr:CinA family protein [Bacillota bacterium]
MTEKEKLNEELKTLAADICGQLLAKKYTIATAESCTGGLIAKTITDNSGVSASFGYGVVTYSNEAKMKILQVKADTLNEHGAVSKETAVEMAAGLKSLSGADFALAVTGIAGPCGGSADKPVGLVYIGLEFPEGNAVGKYIFKGDRNAVRLQTAEAALSMVNDVLDKL